MVYSHDGQGREVAGSLSALLEAAQAGHRVKIKIRNYTIEADNIHIKNGHVSAQVIWFLAQFSIEHFKQKPWWIWEHISTTGFKESALYRLGILPLMYRNVYPVHVSWFVDVKKWKNVFTTDKTGKASQGSKTDLVSSLHAGKKLRLMVSFSKSESMLLGVDNVAVSRNNDVSAQCLRIINYQHWGKYSRKIPQDSHVDIYRSLHQRHYSATIL